MNLKNLTITLLVGAFIASVGFWVTRPTKQVVMNTTNPANSGRTVGSLAGPEIPFDHLTVGGITTYYKSAQFAVGTSTSNGNGVSTTTPCSLQGPDATSTLTSFTVRINNNVGSTKLIEFDVATGTSAFVTSTPSLVYARANVPAGAIGMFNWNGNSSTSPGAGILDGGASTTPNYVWSSSNLIGSGTTTGATGQPNWLVMKVATSSVLIGYTGFCAATFQTL